jgi:hypothetical protein
MADVADTPSSPRLKWRVIVHDVTRLSASALPFIEPGSDIPAMLSFTDRYCTPEE